jgi:hypothetical protein
MKQLEFYPEKPFVNHVRPQYFGSIPEELQDLKSGVLKG